MKLSKEAVQEFNELYERMFGKKLSEGDAEREFTLVIRVVANTQPQSHAISAIENEV